jgi:hypothetical protein
MLPDEEEFAEFAADAAKHVGAGGITRFLSLDATITEGYRWWCDQQAREAAPMYRGNASWYD